LRKIRKAGFERVQVLCSKEFYLEGEGSHTPTKLLGLAVKALR